MCAEKQAPVTPLRKITYWKAKRNEGEKEVSKSMAGSSNEGCEKYRRCKMEAHVRNREDGRVH